MYAKLTAQDGWTTLMQASRYSRAEVVQLLLAHGAEVDVENKVCALIYAVFDYSDIKIFIVAPFTMQDGWTALMLASEGGHADIAELLITAGADKNAQNNVRRRSRHFHQSARFTVSVHLLVCAGGLDGAHVDRPLRSHRRGKSPDKQRSGQESAERCEYDSNGNSLRHSPWSFALILSVLCMPVWRY
jgi:ankyrin repeat protein